MPSSLPHRRQAPGGGCEPTRHQAPSQMQQRLVTRRGLASCSSLGGKRESLSCAWASRPSLPPRCWWQPRRAEHAHAPTPLPGAAPPGPQERACYPIHRGEAICLWSTRAETRAQTPGGLSCLKAEGGGFGAFVCLSPEQVGILIPVFIYSAERVIHLLKRSLFIVCRGEGVRGDARE